MGRVAAIGETVRVQGLALAGVVLLPAEDADAARSQWAGLPADIEVVILTQMARDAVPPAHDGPLTVVMPP
jgi:vacuolar-type H+-ATPase subunit F/Vma7